MNNQLFAQMNRVLGIERPTHKTVEVQSRCGLTVISGDSISNKTMLTGLMAQYPTEDCLCLLTETKTSDNLYLEKTCAGVICFYSDVDVDTILETIKGKPYKNIFIEKYHGIFSSCDYSREVDNMRKLVEFCKNTDTKIFICVDAKREKY